MDVQRYLSGNDIMGATVIGFASNGIGTGEFWEIQLQLKKDDTIVTLKAFKSGSKGTIIKTRENKLTFGGN